MDASLAIRWFVPDDPLHGPATRLGDTWAKGGIRLCAPDLIVYEATNAAFQRVRAGAASREAAKALVAGVLGTGIDFFEPTGLAPGALAFAEKCGLGATYDAFYLSLADHLDCECWTTDTRLFKAASPHLAFLRLLDSR